MNFFGHAAVAGRFSEQPSFLLGAMLPDFCGMLGVRPSHVGSPAVADGVRFHHETDAVFHDLELFRRWCREGTRYLDERGVARGTARAVAHVGTELLLDGAIAEGESARAAYFSGLEAGRDAAVLDALGWLAPARKRLAELARLLEARGVATKVTASSLTERLERALAGRPRLAITARDRPLVAEWVELFHADVVASTPALLAELVGELARHHAA
jgi:hypothetical protein